MTERKIKRLTDREKNWQTEKKTDRQRIRLNIDDGVKHNNSIEEEVKESKSEQQ